MYLLVDINNGTVTVALWDFSICTNCLRDTSSNELWILGNCSHPGNKFLYHNVAELLQMSPARDEHTHIHNKLWHLTNCMSEKKKIVWRLSRSWNPIPPTSTFKTCQMDFWSGCGEIYKRSSRCHVYCGICLFFIPVDYLKLFYTCNKFREK